MFEKLLSLVPYNPGLVHQLAFYHRRMREEANIRRTGLIFIALTFFIQFFAVLSPPQPTVASSDNDLITGGISSAADARQHCVNDTRGYQRIMHYYGISCSAFDNAESLTIHTNAQNYYSMGHNLSSGVDTPVNIDGAGKVYWRKLSTWNQSTWKVLRVRDQDNKVFYVIFDCGNLVSIGIPSSNPLRIAETPATTTVNNPTTPVPINTPVTPVITPNPTPPTTPTPPVTPMCSYNPTLPATQCKPCDKSVSSQDTVACLVVHKTASNVTSGITDANNTTAKAGDVITYTLFAENKGKAGIKDFAFQENLSDVLDYADVTDLHGGTISADKTVVWPAEYINAGETASHQVTVKVKDPIPSTPTSTSDPMHFDLTMTNVYGNSVNIKVPGSPAKVIEVATTTSLPNTGPGTSLFIAACLIIVAGYFYSRASLLARESDIAIKETATV